jgi:endonuclease/exonuclease/phosphatase family metal-dependent hydrolase
MVRIASYNVENFFARPKAFGATDLSVASSILDAFGEANLIIKKAVYTAADRARLVALLLELEIYVRNSQGAIRRSESRDPRWAVLRKNRGTFDRQPQDQSASIQIVADGRGDWIGWIDLAKEPTNEVGTRMTARVIEDIAADILGVIEAEDRPSLVRFNEEMLGNRYRHMMLIDGNDTRGIDVAIMTRPCFPIGEIRSNVDREDVQGIVFSRDCPQYEVLTPDGTVLHLLVNHFKSQSGGGGPLRRRQAAAVREIVDGLIQQGRHVVVMGDLNEGPQAEGGQAPNLAPLFAAPSPLIDCYSLAGFDPGPRPGTFDSCGLRNRLDYIFISKSLEPLVTGGGLFRKGLWGGRVTRPTAWETYPEMNRSAEQASDHAVVFLDLDV